MPKQYFCILQKASQMSYRITSLIIAITIASLGAAATPAKPRTKTKAKPRAQATAVTAASLVNKIESEIDAYDFAAAAETLEKYEEHSDASERRADELRSRIDLGASMLERVEQLIVIDSLTVDKAKFISAFNIDPASGEIHDSGILPEGLKGDRQTAVYSTTSGNSLTWAVTDKKGRHLVTSSLLADGTWEKPASLGENVNMAGATITDYPWLMNDGVTLYFASNDSATTLGGLDIYLTRYDGEKYLEAQNVGFPYNSTADDYMLAIDESTGAGWWATDRNHLGDKVTIYVFVPREMRVNYPQDTPDLINRARLTDYRATIPVGKDYAELLRRIHVPFTRESQQSDEIYFPLPDGRIITSVDQLNTEAARNALIDYLDKEHELAECIADLWDMRSRYEAGDTNVGSDILQAESHLEQLRAERLRLSNMAVGAAMRESGN